MVQLLCVLELLLQLHFQHLFLVFDNIDLVLSIFLRDNVENSCLLELSVGSPQLNFIDSQHKASQISQNFYSFAVQQLRLFQLLVKSCCCCCLCRN